MMKRSTSTQDEFLLAETDCVLAEVTKPLFKKCNDESNRDSEYISLLEQIKSLKPLTAYVIIEDFVYIRSIKLGSGMKFYLIKYKNCLYSLKIIPQVKDPADTDLQLIQIAREEEVLKMVNHPCTIKYIITMIDKDQTRYFLSEFCPGEDLNLVLQELGNSIPLISI